MHCKSLITSIMLNSHIFEIRRNGYIIEYIKDIDRYSQFNKTYNKTNQTNIINTGNSWTQRICIENRQSAGISTQAATVYRAKGSSTKENKFHTEFAVVFTFGTRTGGLLRRSIRREQWCEKVSVWMEKKNNLFHGIFRFSVRFSRPPPPLRGTESISRLDGKSVGGRGAREHCLAEDYLGWVIEFYLYAIKE